ncbi:Gfo/Idh/MocA family oxidoreductase [Bacillus carboniphilus]|uniref:Gfo/Idh/MocA family oxidoreductase n=1 Tax=Bacillus carboniphilus TaxID=86663 RepID=A0ABP3FMU7_9BACI
MKYGVIGTSEITTRFIEASREVADFNLSSVYSRTYERAQDFAKRFGAPNIYTDLEKMAVEGQVDVIYIASPNSLHFEQVVFFLQKKIHVICEKPIFSNVKEFEQAFNVAEENGVFLFEAARNIHSPNFKLLKDQVAKIGKVRSAVLQYMKYSSRYDLVLKGEEPNIFSANFSGGALVDLGVYPVFVAVSLFGDPKDVAYYPVMLPTGVDGSGTLVLQYDDFVCTILCSKITDSFLPNEIHGEKGTVIVDHISSIRKLDVLDRVAKSSETISVPEHENNMVYEIEAFKNIIESKDYKGYEELKRISYSTLKITEAARKFSGIVFTNERE